MERESFIFYRAFYETIRCTPPDIQAELYPAIVEYAILGTLPEGLSPTAKGIFAVIKPTIDANNRRYLNGCKGAIHGKKGGRPPKSVAADIKPQIQPAQAPYSATFAQEVSCMRSDTAWLNSVSASFSITPQEVLARLNAFLDHLARECSDKPHKSLGDAQRHFCSWSRKRFSPPSPPPAPPDYSFTSGFGSLDK